MPRPAPAVRTTSARRLVQQRWGHDFESVLLLQNISVPQVWSVNFVETIRPLARTYALDDFIEVAKQVLRTAKPATRDLEVKHIKAIRKKLDASTATPSTSSSLSSAFSSRSSNRSPSPISSPIRRPAVKYSLRDNRHRDKRRRLSSSPEVGRGELEDLDDSALEREMEFSSSGIQQTIEESPDASGANGNSEATDDFRMAPFSGLTTLYERTLRALPAAVPGLAQPKKRVEKAQQNVNNARIKAQSIIDRHKWDASPVDARDSSHPTARGTSPDDTWTVRTYKEEAERRMKVHRDQKAAVEEAQQRFQELLDQHTNVGFLVEVSKSSETKAEEEILKARTDMEGWEAIFKDLEKVEKELDKAVEALEGAQKDWDAYRSAWDHIQEMHNTLVEKMEEANREMTDALS